MDAPGFDDAGKRHAGSEQMALPDHVFQTAGPEPFRQRRSRYEKMAVADILEPGNRRAAARARETIARVRTLMNV